MPMLASPHTAHAWLMNHPSFPSSAPGNCTWHFKFLFPFIKTQIIFGRGQGEEGGTTKLIALGALGTKLL